MTPKPFAWILAFVLLIVAAVAGCDPVSNDTLVTSTPFIIRVDSITHTPFAALSDTIRVKLYGTVGFDGCHSFLRLDTAQAPLQFDITAWGSRSSATVCPMNVPVLGGLETKTVATQMGWFRIIVHQPDGTTLRDSLIIK